MKRLLIFLLVLLLAAVPCHAVKQSNEIADITYLLRCFSGTTGDQAFVDTQVLDSPAEGCLDGSLTIAGTMASCSSSALLLTNPGISGCWTVGGLDTVAVSRALGTGLFATVNQSSGTTTSVFGFFDSVTFDATSASSIYQSIGADLYPTWSPTGFIALSGAITQLTDHPAAIILGGYNSTGVPYKSGDNKSLYTYGASYFWKGGAYASCTLLWRDSSNNDASLYPVMSQCSNTANTSYKSILVPVYDFSSLLQPTHLSLFGSNGELSVYTPDVGTVWTENTGDWDTAGGFLVNTTAGIATFDAGVTTALYDAKLTMPAAGTTGGGLVARFVDTTHYYKVEAVVGSSNNVKLIEVNGSEPGDARSTASATLDASTEYRFRLIVSAASPYWSIFVNETAKGTYTTEGSSSTGTRFGLYDGGDANFTGFDVISLWARECTGCTSEFAKVGY